MSIKTQIIHKKIPKDFSDYQPILYKYFKKAKKIKKKKNEEDLDENVLHKYLKKEKKKIKTYNTDICLDLKSETYKDIKKESKYLIPQIKKLINTLIKELGQDDKQSKNIDEIYTLYEKIILFILNNDYTIEIIE